MKKILTEIIPVFSIVTALFYMAGWSFCGQYYDHFGLGLGLIDLSFQDVLLFGFTSIYFYYKWILGLSIAIIVAMVIVSKTNLFTRVKDATLRPFFEWLNVRNPSQVASIAGLIMIYTFILVMFVISHEFGKNVGQRTYEEHWAKDFPAAPRIAVWLTAANDSYSPEEVNNGCYRLLRQTSGHIFIFLKPKDVRSSPTLRIYPRNQVRAIHIYNDRISCEEKDFRW
jgi:hypothetical protein